MYHELKCLPIYFEPLANGIKMFEVRKKDRPFRIGDILVINEFIPKSSYPYNDMEFNKKTDEWREVDCGFYTGKFILREIAYILDDKEFCVDGMVILGFAKSID